MTLPSSCDSVVCKWYDCHSVGHCSAPEVADMIVAKCPYQEYDPETPKEGFGSINWKMLEAIVDGASAPIKVDTVTRNFGLMVAQKAIEYERMRRAEELTKADACPNHGQEYESGIYKRTQDELMKRGFVFCGCWECREVVGAEIQRVTTTAERERAARIVRASFDPHSLGLPSFEIAANNILGEYTVPGINRIEESGVNVEGRKEATAEKVVVWKDGTHIRTSGPTWEYENDPDWLVTIQVDPKPESREVK